MKSCHKTQAACILKDYDTEIRTFDLPPLKEGEALVKMLYCGVCSGEAMDWYIARKTNSVLGHEVVGEVIEVNSPANFSPGDHVFVHHHAPCGTCYYCMRNLESNCAVWKASNIVPGGYSEYFIVPSCILAKDVIRIPASLSPKEFIFTEPLGCCFRAMAKATPKPDDRILMIGMGIMGLLSCLVFSRNIKGSIITADFIESRRKKSLELGAVSTVNPLETKVSDFLMEKWDGQLADIVIVHPSSAKAITSAFSCLNPGGKLVLFAPPPPDESVCIDFNSMYFKEIIITSAYSAGTLDCRNAFNFVQAEKEILESLISHEIPLSEIGDALKRIQNQDPSVLKMVVKP